MTPERPHHPYSPSTLQSLEACPCYRSHQNEKPHERTIAGTKAHAAAESGKDDPTLGDDDAAAVAECLDFYESRKRLMEEEADRAFHAAGLGVALGNYQITELTEIYLPVDDRKFDDCDCTTGGYADRILVNWDKTRAEGFDWKYGYWPVTDAQENLQGIAYSLGVFKMFPTVMEVRFWFKQPHLDRITVATFTRDNRDSHYLRVQVVVARAREARKRGDFSTANPAVPICNFCGEIGRCPKVLALACAVGKKFYPVEIPDSIDPTVGTDPKQTPLALRLASVVKVWCDAFRRQVTDRILRGDAPLPEGYKIQTSTARREIIDLAKVKSVALTYLTEQEYEGTLTAVLGEIEGLVSEKAPRGQKTNMVKDFQKKLLDCGAVKKGEPFSFLCQSAGKE